MILIVVPILALAIAAIIITASPRYTVMQQKIDQLHNGIGETITNERVIKSFVREEHEKEKFSRINQELVEKSTAALRMMILMQPVSTLAINVTTLAVVWFARKQTMVGTMELGTLTAFITYLSQILTALNFLANIVLQGTRAAASNRRITEVLQATIDLTDKDAAFPDREITGGSIEFQHVSFRYFKKNHQKVLNDISLSIESGETVGIIGSTGSGKSTVVRLLQRFYDVGAGSVRINGRDVRTIPRETLSAMFGAAMQNDFLYSDTIEENIRFGRALTHEQIVEAAMLAQADEFIQQFPDKYDTWIEQGGTNVSGGQKQRILIARALAARPEILVLDDSSSALDYKTDAALRHALAEQLGGKTQIIVAQRISTVLHADQIVVLDEGRVVGCGTHAELMDACEPYREIALSQLSEEELEGGDAQ